MTKQSSVDYLDKCIAEGEHQGQDFKFEIDSSKKIARSLSAFANSKGGRLLIGVKDNGKVKGIISTEEKHMVEAASQLHTKPEVPIHFISHNYKGKIVLEVVVKKGHQVPYWAPDPKGILRAYIRTGDKNRIADPIQVRVWQKLKKKESVQIIYSESERFLLSYLDIHESISLKEYIAYAGITEHKAGEILTNLCCVNLIDIRHTGEENLFIAKDGNKIT
ncbi:MAG: ATP-binding protein [Bacteroidota bacterium]|nr:ATP-binding protein [Bacteroidota bacterium]